MQLLPAHVDYVTDEPEDVVQVVEFIVQTLSEPFNAALFAVGTVGAIAAVVAGLWLRGRVPDFRVLATTLDSYRDLVPWMLRLSIGLPALGAGFSGYLFTPVVGTDYRIPLIAVGFLLLTGTATRAVALVGLVLWITGAILNPALLLALEFPFAFVAIVLAGPGRPSGDGMLSRLASTPGTYYREVDPVRRITEGVSKRLDEYEALVPVIVRIGLGLAFIYLGVAEKLLNPARAMLVVEKYNLTAVVPVDPGVWVIGAAATEIGVGLLLLGGFLTRGTAAVAFIVLTTTLFGLPDDPVLAHVSLFGLTSAVFTLGAGPYSLDWLLDQQTPDAPDAEAAPSD